MIHKGSEAATHDASYDLGEFNLKPFGEGETKRLTVPAAEEVLYQPKFTDHGFVRLIDYIGGDQAIAYAATGGVGLQAVVEAQDLGLPGFFDALRAKGIHNPFKFAQMKVQMEMPVAHALFWVYHECFKINEYSGRYSEMMETARQVNKKELKLLLQEELEKVQSEKARKEYLDDVAMIIAGAQKQSWGSYQGLLAADLTRELSRIVLGLGTYTKFYASANLAEWADVVEDAKRVAEEEPDHGAFAEELDAMLKRLAPEAMAAIARDRVGKSKKQRLTINYAALEQNPSGEPRYGVNKTKRLTIPEVEPLLFVPQKYLNAGWFMPTDYMGNDSAFVQSARVSYGAGTTKASDDVTLVRYLRRHHHTTPFEHVSIQAEQKTPVFVWPRQGGRHRTFNKCGVLRTYPVLQDWYDVPEDQLRSQSGANRQGRGDLLDESTREVIKSNIGASLTTQRWSAEKLRGKKVPEWIVAFIKGVGHYTRGTLKVDAHNAFNFLRLRDDDHAQHEIQLNARQWASFIQQVAPHASKAFLDYEKNALIFTVPDQELIGRMLAEGKHEVPFEWYARLGWTKKNPYTGEVERGREANELDSKIMKLFALVKKSESTV
jgi:thymidylate synthase (FAD)